MSTIVAPTKEAVALAVALGRKAGKEDTWMVPCPEEYRAQDVGEMSDAHRAGWEETNHFEHYYGSKLTEITDTQVLLHYEDLSEIDSEERHYSFYQPLLEAFWDAYEEESNFYDLAAKYVRKPK